MRTTIDSAGRIVIPKDIRERASLAGGTEVEITERDGLVQIEPAPTPMRLVKRGRGRAAVPGRKLPRLTDEMVRETTERIRR